MENHMITTADGFQYSVNINYDVGNAKRIASYIPTDAFVHLASGVMDSLKLQSTNRSRIVVGPYGTGKSHLITVVASVLKKSIQLEDYSPLVERLKSAGYDPFVPKFKRFLHGDPYLTVLLNGNGKSLEQTFIYGLQRALLEVGVQDLMPRTSFEAVNETLELWETDYPSTLAQFKSLLSEIYEISYSNFYGQLMECDPRAISVFREIFPKVTAGSEFNLFDTKDIPELYQEVSVLLRDKGYRGIYVIFDEFNKFLESSLQNGKLSDLKLIQDLAEMCNRSGDAQVHLMLISHQQMSQYATGLSDELIDTWRKVEGRFTSMPLRQSSSKTYQLIAAVIEKEQAKWGSFRKSNEVEFHTQLKATRENGLFRELNEDEIEHWVINGCYPLHPSTVFCLPRISNRLAQNERTLFTFLATGDMNTLAAYLSHADDKKYGLLTPDVLFDYFLELAQKQRNQDSLGKSFLKAKESMNNMGASPKPVETRMLKCLAVLVGLEEPSFPPTYANLKFCLSGGQSDSEELENAFKNLVEQKIVYERKSDGRIQFLASSDIDFRSAMDSVKGDSRYADRFRTCDILNEFFSPYPVIANRYNDEYEMTRFFYQEFFSVEELDQGIDWDEYLEARQYADGIVVYVLAETKEKLALFQELVKTIHHPQVIFVCSNTPMNGLTGLSYDYMALDILQRDTTIWGDDPQGMAELSAYVDDYEEQIERELLRVTGYGDKSARLFYEGQTEKSAFRHSSLSQLVSRICSKVFNKTPRLNNELINRSNVSNTIVNARKKVMKALLGDTIEVNLGLKGYGPDVSVFRSMVRRTGVYREVNNKAEFAIDEAVSPEFRIVIELVQDTLKSRGGTVSFAEVIHNLRKPPYGLRPGVLPVVLAIALRAIRKSLIVRDQSDIESPLDENLIESIVKNPKGFSAEILGIDDSKQVYLEKLGELFKDDLPSSSAGSNSAYPVAVAVKQWFVGLPRYTRESRQYSAIAQRMRRVLAVPISDSAKFLFEDMIWAINEINVFEADKVNDYVDAIQAVKSEMEIHLVLSRRHLKQVAIRLFDGEGSNLPLGIVMRNWYLGLKESTRTHVFSGDCLSLLRLAGKMDVDNDDSPIDEMIRLITGLNLSDWSDDTYQSFEDSMAEAIAIIEGIDRDETLLEMQQRVTFVERSGRISEHTYAKVEVGELGNILRSSLESALDGFADAIDMEEKRQVLLDLLLKIS